MASEGPNSPGTMANETSVGSVAWGNVNDAVSSNDTYATNNIVGSQSNYLKSTNFGFALPLGATIVGIVAEFERKWNGLFSGATDTSIRLVKNGTIQGDNKSAGAAWSATEAYVSFGGAADLWGLTPSRDDVNASDFGVVISATGGGGAGNNISVDHVRMTVYYTTESVAVGGAAGHGGMMRRVRVAGY